MTASTQSSRRTPVRVLIPAVLTLLWLAWTAWGGQTFGAISEVTTNDQATFLPADAESTQALELQERFGDDDAVPATVIAAPVDGELTEDLTAEMQAAGESASDLEGVIEVTPPQPSEDGEAVQLTVLLDEVAAEEGALTELRELISSELPEQDWDAYVTGPAALSADLSEAFAGVDGLLLLVAVVAVFIILVSVYRSALLPILVLLSSVGALCAAITVIYFMADAGWIQLNGQVQGSCRFWSSAPRPTTPCFWWPATAKSWRAGATGSAPSGQLCDARHRPSWPQEALSPLHCCACCCQT